MLLPRRSWPGFGHRPRSAHVYMIHLNTRKYTRAYVCMYRLYMPAQVFDYGVNWEEVKNAALPLLQKFTAHTNGANIKMRDSGLAWSYYSTDPEWGQTQAKQLHGELEVGDRKIIYVPPFQLGPHDLRSCFFFVWPAPCFCLGDGR